MYVSFLSASTPSWLNRSVNADVIEGGFTSRCIFVVSGRRKRAVAWPSEADARTTDAQVEQLVNRLVEIRRKARHIRSIGISDGGLKTFARWYEQRPESSDAFRGSFESREDAHVLRLAACLAANQDGWRIHSNHIQTSIRLISDAKEAGASIFQGTGVIAKEAQATERLINILIEASTRGLYEPEINNKMRHIVNADFVRTPVTYHA